MPSGNSIAKHCHQTVKRTAKIVLCSILGEVYWYYVCSQDNCKLTTAPANQLYEYEMRVRGVDNNKNALDPCDKITNLNLEIRYG